MDRHLTKPSSLPVIIFTTVGLRIHSVNSERSMGIPGHSLLTHCPHSEGGRLVARLRLRKVVALLVAAMCLALPRPAEAATFTWTGSSNDSSWS